MVDLMVESKKLLVHITNNPQTFYPFLSPQDAPEEIDVLLAQAPFELELQCRGKEYTLGVQQGSEKASGTFAAADLTTMPVHGASFAGVMLGIYSFGKGEPVLDPADFSEITLQELSQADE